MNNKEAIEYLKWVRPKKPYTQDKKNVQTAIDMAIEALKETERNPTITSWYDFDRGYEKGKSASRSHGEWITKKDSLQTYCSHCDTAIPYSDEYDFSDFILCPYCGADMRKEGEAK